MSLDLFPSGNFLFSFRPSNATKDEAARLMVEIGHQASESGPHKNKPVFSLRGLESLIEQSSTQASSAMLDISNLVDRSLHVSMKAPEFPVSGASLEITEEISPSGVTSVYEKALGSRLKDALYFEGLLKLIYSLDSNKTGKVGTKIRSFQKAFAESLWKALERSSESNSSPDIIASNLPSSDSVTNTALQVDAKSPTGNEKKVPGKIPLVEVNEDILKRMFMPPSKRGEFGDMSESKKGSADSLNSTLDTTTREASVSVTVDHSTQMGSPESKASLAQQLEFLITQHMAVELKQVEQEEFELLNEMADENTTNVPSLSSDSLQSTKKLITFTSAPASSSSGKSKVTDKRIKDFFGEEAQVATGSTSTLKAHTLGGLPPRGEKSIAKVQKFFGDEELDPKAVSAKWVIPNFPHEKVQKMTKKNKKSKESKETVEKKLGILKKLAHSTRFMTELAQLENESLTKLTNEDPSTKPMNDLIEIIKAMAETNNQFRKLHGTLREDIFELMQILENNSGANATSKSMMPAHSDFKENAVRGRESDVELIAPPPQMIEVYRSGKLSRRKSIRRLVLHANPLDGGVRISVQRLVDTPGAAITGSVEQAVIFPQDIVDMSISGKQVSIKFKTGPRSSETLSYHFQSNEDRRKLEQFAAHYFTG